MLRLKKSSLFAEDAISLSFEDDFSKEAFRFAGEAFGLSFGAEVSEKSSFFGGKLLLRAWESGFAGKLTRFARKASLEDSLREAGGVALWFVFGEFVYVFFIIAVSVQINAASVQENFRRTYALQELV